MNGSRPKIRISTEIFKGHFHVKVCTRYSGIWLLLFTARPKQHTCKMRNLVWCDLVPQFVHHPCLNPVWSNSVRMLVRSIASSTWVHRGGIDQIDTVVTLIVFIPYSPTTLYIVDMETRPSSRVELFSRVSMSLSLRVGRNRAQ